MAINIQYQPEANLLGTVANQAGQGMFQQRQADRAQTQNNMLLQATLAERQQRMGFAMDQARLGAQLQAQQIAQRNDLARMNYAANLQAQQQMFQQQLAVQNQQNDLAFRQAAGANQLELQRQMGFAELDQNKQMLQLRNSNQASQAWNQLQAERNNIQQAYSEGWLNDDQYAAAQNNFAMKLQGFNPSQYPLDGPYPPNQGLGDIWDETRSFPGVGDLTLKYTRDRSGQPVLTDDSQWYLDNIVAPQAQQQMGIGKGATGKAQGGQTPEGVSITDYTKLWESTYKAMSQTDPETGMQTPPDLDAVEQQIERIYDAYQRRGGQQMPMQGGGQGETFTGGIPDGGMPMPQQQAAPQQSPMPQQPQQQGVGYVDRGNQSLRDIYGIPPQQMPANQFAKFVVGQDQQLAKVYMRENFPGGPQQVYQLGSPDDIALLEALLSLKARLTR
jgi:hypothetical protein